MELPRGSIKELTDPRNKDVVATNTPQLWACYRRSMNRAMYLAQWYPRQTAKIKALEEAMFQTASMGGKGLEALRDVGIGYKQPPSAVGVTQPRSPDGVPQL